MKISLRKSI